MIRVKEVNNNAYLVVEDLHAVTKVLRRRYGIKVAKKRVLRKYLKVLLRDIVIDIVNNPPTNL